MLLVRAGLAVGAVALALLAFVRGARAGAWLHPRSRAVGASAYRSGHVLRFELGWPPLGVSVVALATLAVGSATFAFALDAALDDAPVRCVLIFAAPALGIANFLAAAAVLRRRRTRLGAVAPVAGACFWAAWLPFWAALDHGAGTGLLIAAGLAQAGLLGRIAAFGVGLVPSALLVATACGTASGVVLGSGISSSCGGGCVLDIRDDLVASVPYAELLSAELSRARRARARKFSGRLPELEPIPYSLAHVHSCIGRLSPEHADSVIRYAVAVERVNRELANIQGCIDRELGRHGEPCPDLDRRMSILAERLHGDERAPGVVERGRALREELSRDWSWTRQ